MMDVACPNCTTKLTVTAPPASPSLCNACEKPVYFPDEFPAIVALTFPSQASAAVELVPFFHISPSQMAPELSGETPGITQPLGVQADPEPEPDPVGHTAIIRHDEVMAQPPVVDDPFNENTPTEPQHALPEPPVQEPLTEPEPQVGVASQAGVAAGVSDDLQLLSLAGGSFAAALTPPPPAAIKPPAASALQSVSTESGPAPWDTVAPPVLGKEAKDEGWSIGGTAPPPLAAQKGPPAIPKKNEIDAFAEALGLPPIPQSDRPDKAPPPAIVVANPTESDSEDDGALLKKHRQNLFLYGGLGVVVLIALAIIIANAASKDPVPDTLPTAVTGTTTSAAVTGATAAALSGATAVSGAAAVSGTTGSVDDKKAVDPVKRALALDHYMKGNKLYLQRKYVEALAEYKKALDADQTFALAYRGLGVTYASQNKREKAIESYKAYLRMAPDAKDASSVKMIIQKAEAEK